MRSFLGLIVIGTAVLAAGVAGIPFVLGGDGTLLPHVRVMMLGTVLVGLLVWFAAFGRAISVYWTGMLVNGLNNYSLSRLQMVGWTWIILGSLATVCAIRLWTGHGATALHIFIPDNLFLALGISYASGVAAPSLLSLKAREPQATTAQVAAATSRFAEPVQALGQVAERPKGQTPRFADMILGDDIATAGTVDISKVQQLLITVLLLCAYLMMVVVAIRGGGAVVAALEPGLRDGLIEQKALLCGFETAQQAREKGCGVNWSALPDFPSMLVTLLGISHAGYLAFKVAPRAPATGS